MYQSKKIVCVIPARLASTRFPKKVLALLAGKPLLQRVYEAALSCRFFDEVIIAVDHETTFMLAKSFGAKTLMTSPFHQNGTERLQEVKNQHHVKADLYVNWQADEPFICEKMIEDLLSSCLEEGMVWTLRKRIFDPKEIEDPSIVKVVVDKRENALYFSRSPIPFYRDEKAEKIYYKHIGLYAYSPLALEKMLDLEVSDLEKAESLEQLRILSFGLSIKVHLTEYETLGIDLPEHLHLAQKLLEKKEATLV